jgi:formate dehydrogenase iron-sulfur subunit
MSKALLYDATVCIGCKQCEAGCAQQNKLPYDDKVAAENVTSDHKFTTVLAKNDKFMRRICMHCQDPACASVCPVGALQKTAAGPVVYLVDRCMGCRYCMVACPFGVPKYEWSKLNPKVQKCIMCSDRVKAGQPTACAEACPTGATKFGDRDELMKEAQQRLHDNPSNYVPHVFGVEEVGGTSVLMLSGVAFEEFGLNPAELPKDPLPLYTYRVLSRIPDFVPLGGMMLGGIWWITHRRDEVSAAENTDKKDKGGAQ